MIKKLFTCGCSYSYGLYAPKNRSTNRVIREEISKVPNYTDYLSERYNLETVNFARPGASNYCIIKQIQKAIEYKPDFIIFNTTSVQRIDFVPSCKKLEREPSFDDFYDLLQYSSKNVMTRNSDDKKIISNVEYAYARKYYLDEPPAFTREFIDDFETLHNYILKFSNFHLTQDKYRYMLLGILYTLEISKIPYLVLDFFNYLKHDRENILQIEINEMLKKFSFEKDPYHFDENGHEYLSNEISKKIEDFIL